MSRTARLVVALALSLGAAVYAAARAQLPLNDACKPSGAVAALRARIFPHVLRREREAVVRRADAETRFAEIVLEQERKKNRFCVEHPGLCGPSERYQPLPGTTSAGAMTLARRQQAGLGEARLAAACRVVGANTGS